MLRFMKSFIIVSILFALTLTTALPTYADESNPTNKENSYKYTVDDAIEIVKEKLHIPDDYELENASLDYTEKWSIFWTSSRNDSSIKVRIEPVTGKIFGIEANYQVENTSNANLSILEAKKLADGFIQYFYPEIFDKVEIVQGYIDSYTPTSTDPALYTFPYRQLVNGIPYERENLFIYVNKNGDVTHFYYSAIQDIHFRNTNNLLTKEEAVRVMEEQMNMSLQWITLDSQTKPYLAYVSSTTYQIVDAETGDVYTQPGYELIPTEIQTLVAQPLEAKSEARSQILSEEEAINLARMYANALGYKAEGVSNAQYMNNYGTPSSIEKLWAVSWEEQINRYQMTISLRINPESGELYIFYAIPKATNNEKNPINVLSYPKAKEMAIQAVKELYKTKAHELYLQNASFSKDFGEITFTFYRAVDGIPTTMNHVNVQLDLQVGIVKVVNIRWDDSLEYPSEAPKTIDKAIAKKFLVDQLDLELVYTTDYKPLFFLLSHQDNQKRQAIPVYKPRKKYSNDVFLDAITGEWRSFKDGSVVVIAKP